MFFDYIVNKIKKIDQKVKIYIQYGVNIKKNI